MTNPTVRPSLKRIEKGIQEIKEKLCEIEPCEPEDEDVATSEPSEEE